MSKASHKAFTQTATHKGFSGISTVFGGMLLPGRVKAGEGTLIGNAGEYFVVAELLRKGIIAALAPRNAPAFDVLATKGNNTARIRVKTKTAGNTGWHYVAKNDATVFRHLSDTGDFTVLVNLPDGNELHDLRFYILPTRLINEILQQDFDAWVATPGKNGRPHDSENKIRKLSEVKYNNILKKYLNEWDTLWKDY